MWFGFNLVTLFAPGNSDTLAWLEASCLEGLLNLSASDAAYAVYQQMQLSRVFGQASTFDIIHSHVGYSVLPYAKLSKTPVLHTLYEPISELTEPIFSQHRTQHFVSTHHDDRRDDLRLNYVATVEHAIASNTAQLTAVSLQQMVDRYEGIYRKLLGQQRRSHGRFSVHRPQLIAS